MGKDNIKYKLPEGWISATIGDVLNLEYGKSLPHMQRNSNGKYPVYGSNGIIGYHDEYLVNGPVIIVGRKGSVGTIHLEKDRCWPIDTTYYINIGDSVNLYFIFYLLKTLNLSKLDSSTAIPGINRNSIYEKQISIPPFNEQNRIVAKIEELLSELDHAEKILKKAQIQLKIYRQSLLKSAFEGKLSENWRSENSPQSAITFLQNINENRRVRNELFKTEKKIGLNLLENRLNKDFVFIDKSLIQKNNIPSNWFFTTFESISENYDELRIPLSKSKRESINGVYPYYGATEIIDYVDNYIFDGKFILIGEDGANLVSKNKPLAFIVEGKFWVNNHAHVVRTNENEVLMKYLVFYFNTLRLNQHISGTTQPKLNKYNLNLIYIPICPINEQKIIIQEIESKFTLIEHLEKNIYNGLKKTDLFRHLILKTAFEGKLAPQYLGDESANKLLKQIIKEKANISENIKAHLKQQPKIKKMIEGDRSIIDILKDAEKPVPAKELWLSSEFKDNIDAFYAQLKKLIENNTILEIPREGKESFIKLIHEDENR